MFNRNNTTLEIRLFGYLLEILVIRYTWMAGSRWAFSRATGCLQILWKEYQFQLQYRKDRSKTTAQHITDLEKWLGVKVVKSKEFSVFTLNSW